MYETTQFSPTQKIIIKTFSFSDEKKTGKNYSKITKQLP
jgi:hypothetical protein